MEKQRICIQSVSQDVIIGKVFNDLFNIIKQSQQNNNNVVWDFADTFYLHPFLLFPLAVYRYQNNIKCINIRENTNIQKYLELVCFENLFDIKDNQSLEDKLSEYYDKSYIPISSFSINENLLKQLQTPIQTIIERQCRAEKISTQLSYFIGELIDNIREHSSADKGFIFSQYLQSEKCLNICIADNGITVLGSYYKTNKYLDIIHNNPAIALSQALNGLSTKSKERGFGLSSSKKMLVQGLKGAFFVMSGNAFYRYDLKLSDKEQIIPLNEEYYWKGTVVLIKIPVPVPQEFNFYNYIE